MTKKEKHVADFIVPLNMNGLEGRMLRLPAQSKNRSREIMVVYGHHALLERWWGLAENFADYGNVTIPDLPGFGGMDSFSKISKVPTVDNFADYLAAFIKMHYKRHRVTIAGISFGFVVVTRMLQKYPELANKVDLLVSIVGFMHRDDFAFKTRNRKFFQFATAVIATKPIAWIIRYALLNRFIINLIYVRMPFGKRRFIEMEPTDFTTMMDFEVRLWQCNDVRTHWYTTSEFLNIDNCKSQIALPVWHVASSGDYYFNNDIVEQHMRVVFTDYNLGVMKSTAHTPSVLGDKKELGVMLPQNLRKVLRQTKA